MHYNDLPNNTCIADINGVDCNEFLQLVGDNIRKTRWAGELTQQGVANKGFSLRHIQLMERGDGNPTLATLHELADALDTTVAALVDVDPAATVRAVKALEAANPSAPKRGRKARVVTKPKRKKAKKK